MEMTTTTDATEIAGDPAGLGDDEDALLDWRRPKRPNSPKAGADELAALMRTHGLRSKTQFTAWQRQQPAAPSIYRVIQAFGGWQQAKCVAFGEAPPIPMPIPKTDEQLIHLVAGLRIASRRHYQRLRNAQPSLFPPMYDVLRRFGYWNTLKRLACAVSVPNILTRYALLRLQLGRWPWKYECRENGVEVDRLLKTMPLRDVKELLLTMEKYGVKVTQGGGSYSWTRYGRQCATGKWSTSTARAGRRGSTSTPRTTAGSSTAKTASRV